MSLEVVSGEIAACLLEWIMDNRTEGFVCASRVSGIHSGAFMCTNHGAESWQ